ncbi:UDP-2,4-diacetamido-2,4,6-trideoxy-beta-L-altropyranose hydrolase [Candidatus Electronema sp. JM]|uniref:UDP-2,4-diacetamido-2,4, 6-trideoxy-beta-L-altropyranose hydrolase n=1 Tax=Candidatus Electronema sp. JM TaxID=3401571 RepID=UPI003AA84733
MQIAIRTDASFAIGSGHVMRCLTLAEQLRKKNVDVLFFCRNLTGNLNNFIADRGFDLCVLPPPQHKGISQEFTWNFHAAWLEVPWEKDADETVGYLQKRGDIDCLIIDHYAIEKNWEQRQRPFAQRIIVIDDLADRAHDCDLLLDQNLDEYPEKKYQGLLPNHCIQLIGPKYAVLRQEFIEMQKHLRHRDGSVHRVVLSFGGADLYDLTSKVLEAIRIMNIQKIEFDVVAGGQNPHAEKVQELCSQMPNTRYYCQVSNMSKLMADADLAIGGAGGTTWERCFFGLPAIIFSMADNQTANAELISQRGAACYMGRGDSFDCGKFTAIFQSLLRQPEYVIKMSRSAADIMDGWQGSEAIIQHIMQ